MDAERFEHLNVLIKKNYKMTSRRLSTVMRESVETMSSARDILQRPGGELNEDVAGAPVLKKRECMEGAGAYTVRDGVCFFLGRVSGEAERAATAVPDDCSPSTVLGELLGGKCLPSSVDCVKERMCVNRVRMFDGDVRVLSVGSELIGRELCSSLDDYHGVLSALRAWRTDGCVLREQTVCAS